VKGNKPKVSYQPTRRFGYRAFISYSHLYKDWVDALHRDLQDCLERFGEEPKTVFLDSEDLRSGTLWLRQLQGALTESEHLVLVVTPEALASPHVEGEWSAFLSRGRDWLKGRFHVVRLLSCPLPPFLSSMEYRDFQEHDDVRYRKELGKLVEALLARRIPRLQAFLDMRSAPKPPRNAVPPALRERLVGCITPLMKRRIDRRAMESILRLPSRSLDGHPTPDCAASSAIVEATEAEDPVNAALCMIDVLREELQDDFPNTVLQLDDLQQSLAAKAGAEEEADPLGHYLHQVATNHDRLVPYLQQGAVTGLLEQVYVRLTLRQGVLSEEGELVQIADENERGTPLSLDEVLGPESGDGSASSRHWVILGDPGAGKTTLIRHLAATLARTPGRTWVPVLDSLPRLMREPEWFLKRLADRLRRAGHEAASLPALLDLEGREGRLLLLFDGLDEVPKEKREEAEGLLKSLVDRWPSTPLVVTSRPIGYRRPGDDFRELEILPLAEPRRLEFLGRWFGRKKGINETTRAGEVLEVLKDDPGLWELCGNPLYLTLIAFLVEEGKFPHQQRAKLYDQVFDLLLRGKHREGDEPLPAQQAATEALQYLGYQLTLDNRDSEPIEQLENRFLGDDFQPIRTKLYAVKEWTGKPRVFLEDLAQKTGILGPGKSIDEEWGFRHDTYREALAARELEARLQTYGLGAILDHGGSLPRGSESRWAEPYALLLGRVSDPERILPTLAKVNQALALQAVATMPEIEAATITSLLSRTRGTLERPDGGILALPEIVGDARRALLLIDRLRKTTRNGIELYFLYEALRRTEERFSEYQQQVNALRANFFDRIPPPPQGLFEQVETPVAGHVPLWREIPEGSFWMGSKEHEPGESWEYPRHQVTLTRGLAIACVAVTNGQYAAFDPEKTFAAWKGATLEELLNYPRVLVTWWEAVSFCRWLSSHLSGVRLPTEEEWEYVCRAGTDTAYFSGETEADLQRVAWYDANSLSCAHRVAQKEANPWGLYDMHGNVWEWTASSWTAERYAARGPGVSVDPAVPGSETDQAGWDAMRAIRGGSHSSSALGTRAGTRAPSLPQLLLEDQGFRLVRVI